MREKMTARERSSGDDTEGWSWFDGSREKTEMKRVGRLERQMGVRDRGEREREREREREMSPDMQVRPDVNSPMHRPQLHGVPHLSLTHLSEPTRQTHPSYAAFCETKKKTLLPLSSTHFFPPQTLPSHALLSTLPPSYTLSMPT